MILQVSGRESGEERRDLVAALAERFALAHDAVGPLSALLSLLCDDPLAPTAIRDPRRVAEDHLADSLVALELPCVVAATRIADLGSGAGIPGLVLAIALPAAEVTLIESAGRKCDFLRVAIDACGVRHASVVCRRAEEWPQGIGRCDLVTARALAPLPVVAEYAAPLLRVGGSLVAWRGRRDPEEERAAARAAARLGLRVQEPVAVSPHPGARHRHLQRLVKVSETPPGFPRRAGMARKRPLGAAPAGRGRQAAESDRPRR